MFGDSFWKDSAVGQSAANVRALTYCDLHTIKRERLLEVLDFYQAFANSFARNLTLTYNLRHRLIFRKVADVRRERELMERRKREPQLEQAQDHLVRKIFSRFRRERSVAAAPAPTPRATDPAQPDPERGDSSTGAAAPAGDGPARRLSLHRDSSPRAGRSREDDAAATPAAAAPAAPTATGTGAARGKWGRLLAGGSLDAGADAPRASFSRSLSVRDRAVPSPAAPAPATDAAPAAPAGAGAAALAAKVSGAEYGLNYGTLPSDRPV